eukprot:NODE_9028_length_667_cov_40.040441_g8765_i0.p1 GENE.NODE_9028_length_667_cov_40.040441_g8765_i0~~NODE_9028_length_667_cov_40.040441_g8765_i0.p1  ORF type:complete len:158 (+),score=38.98 NODE_9028_length_667_cov_40.040441_g8765_i0:53-526(+)
MVFCCTTRSSAAQQRAHTLQTEFSGSNLQADIASAVMKDFGTAGRAMSYEMFADAAAELGMRLPTTAEAQQFLANKPYPAAKGKDKWVPTVSATGSKDWVQVGNRPHPAGRSHNTLGTASWQNSTRPYGFRQYALLMPEEEEYEEWEEGEEEYEEEE